MDSVRTQTISWWTASVRTLGLRRTWTSVRRSPGLRQPSPQTAVPTDMVSIDAMQEFRIQTSTYAPYFGRSPGAQVSIVTKSGTNQFHGSAFDYLRNELFDARNWFDVPPLIKPPLRQNDFGGTLGGPPKEGSNLLFSFLTRGCGYCCPRQHQPSFYTASARQAVAPAYKPYVNALPLPVATPIDPTCDNLHTPCVAPLTVGYSDPSGTERDQPPCGLFPQQKDELSLVATIMRHQATRFETGRRRKSTM